MNIELCISVISNILAIAAQFIIAKWQVQHTPKEQRNSNVSSNKLKFVKLSYAPTLTLLTLIVLNVILVYRTVVFSPFNMLSVFTVCFCVGSIFFYIFSIFLLQVFRMFKSHSKMIEMQSQFTTKTANRLIEFVENNTAQINKLTDFIKTYKKGIIKKSNKK